MSADSNNDWLVVLNPHAGGGRGSHDKEMISDLLRTHGFVFKMVVSEYPRHAIGLTIDFVQKGYKKIIVAGGDGTLNEVVNGVFLQESVDPKIVKIGMLPVGTGNDWIKTFGITTDYEEALQIIKEDKHIFQDVGNICYAIGKEHKTRYFANMAGFGFDAMVAAKANKLKEKGRSGLLVYLQSFLSGYINFRICKTRLVIGDDEINDLVFSASIGIGKFNGGGMMQAPDAVPNNGEFQITVIRKIGLFGIIKNIAGLYSGKFVHDKRVATYNANKITVNGSSKIPGEADGETLGNSTFEIEIIPAKLQVIYGDDKYLEKEIKEDLKEKKNQKRLARVQ